MSLNDRPTIVERRDDNPLNVTFGHWSTMTTFPDLVSARAFVARAEGPTQPLRIRVGESA
jgi:hypothetical protein